MTRALIDRTERLLRHTQSALAAPRLPRMLALLRRLEALRRQVAGGGLGLPIGALRAEKEPREPGFAVTPAAGDVRPGGSEGRWIPRVERPMAGPDLPEKRGVPTMTALTMTGTDRGAASPSPTRVRFREEAARAPRELVEERGGAAAEPSPEAARGHQRRQSWAPVRIERLEVRPPPGGPRRPRVEPRAPGAMPVARARTPANDAGGQPPSPVPVREPAGPPAATAVAQTRPPEIPETGERSAAPARRAAEAPARPRPEASAPLAEPPPGLRALPASRTAAPAGGDRPPFPGAPPAVESQEPSVPAVPAGAAGSTVRPPEIPPAQRRPALLSQGLHAVAPGSRPGSAAVPAAGGTARGAPADPGSGAAARGSGRAAPADPLPFPAAAPLIPEAWPAAAAGEAASDDDDELHKLAERLERLLRAEARRHGMDL